MEIGWEFTGVIGPKCPGACGERRSQGDNGEGCDKVQGDECEKRKPDRKQGSIAVEATTQNMPGRAEVHRVSQGQLLHDLSGLERCRVTLRINEGR